MDQRPEKGPCAVHIRHMKNKSIWVMVTASTGVKDGVGPGHSEACMRVC